jgi:hypothetical protein
MRSFCLVTLALFAALIPAHANLVVDPGFESCPSFPGATPPGWTVTSGEGYCGPGAHTGNWSADVGTVTLSQTLTTTPGDVYDFSFWLTNFSGSPNSFTADFGGYQTLNLTNSNAFGYVLEDFTVIATGTSTVIAFTGAANGGGWAVDDVSVTDQGPSPAPEPASVALLGIGLLGLFYFGHRVHSEKGAGVMK